MQAIKWSGGLSVGVDLIDQQHQALIQHMNDVGGAIEDCAGEREIARTLSFLLEYTDFHFSAEEEHMRSSNYPALDEHRQKHEEFKKTLARLEQEYLEEGATKLLAESLETLLWNWLVNHIQTVDRAFGGYLAEQGITIG